MDRYCAVLSCPVASFSNILAIYFLCYKRNKILLFSKNYMMSCAVYTENKIFTMLIYTYIKKKIYFCDESEISF